VSFLDDAHYLAFLRETHPELALSLADDATPTFTGTLDTRAPLLPGRWRALRDLAHTLAPARVAPRALFVGVPFEPYEQTRLLDDIGDLTRFTGELRVRAREGQHDVVVLTNVHRMHPRVDALKAHGFLELPSFPDCVLSLDGMRSFDDVLATRSRVRRRNARRHLHRFARAGHTVKRVHDSQAYARALFDSYAPFYARANVRWFPHSERYFAGVAALDARVVLSVAFDNHGAVSGFVLGFVDDRDGVRTFHSGRIGVHPTYHMRDAVYFRMVYRAIEDAIACGAERISLEPTAYRVKRRLGAHIVPLVNLILPVSTLWRLVARRAASLGARALRHLDDVDVLEEHY
jgi:hypothetical protein